jgi:hypothetical protein
LPSAIGVAVGCVVAVIGSSPGTLLFFVERCRRRILVCDMPERKSLLRGV